MEGSAATPESIYGHQHYGIDNFSSARGPNLSERIKENTASNKPYVTSGSEADIN